MFTEKIGMLPERIFEALLNDRLVAKGTVLTVVTHIFREYLKHSTIDELVALLTRGKIVHRLLDYFPPGKQTEECFEEHFGAAGMQNVVRPLRLRAATNTGVYLDCIMRALVGISSPVRAVHLPPQCEGAGTWRLVQTLCVRARGELSSAKMVVLGCVRAAIVSECVLAPMAWQPAIHTSLCWCCLPYSGQPD